MELSTIFFYPRLISNDTVVLNRSSSVVKVMDLSYIVRSSSENEKPAIYRKGKKERKKNRDNIVPALFRN